MRGICSISTCQFAGEGSKVHEAFEGVKELTICWDCGDKILKGFCTFDEFKLREQIAQEIEGLLIGWVDSGTFNQGIIAAVNIARGE